MLTALGLKTNIVCNMTAFRLKWKAGVDPMVAEPSKLLRRWTVALSKNKALERQLAKAWIRPNILDLLAGRKNWPAAIGPTTGVVKTLLEIGGMQTAQQGESTKKKLATRKPKDQASFVEQFAGSIEESLRKEAANRRLGSGFEYGEPMLRSVTGYIAQLK